MKKIGLILMLFAVMAATPDVRHMQMTRSEGDSEFPSLAWTGSELGVAWMDGRDGNQEIYFATADMSARSTGTETRITRAWTWDDHPQVCWTGSEFGLSWIHEKKTLFDLKFQKIGPDGRPKGSALTLIRQARQGKDTGICWTGAGYGIVSTEFKGGINQADLVFRFIDESGKPLGSPVTLSSGGGVKTPGSLIRIGSDFGLFYLNSSVSGEDVYFLKLDPFGQPRGTPSRLNIPGTRCGLPSASTNGALAIAVWVQQTASGQQVMVVAVSGQGEVKGAPYPVSDPGANRPSAAVASGPNGFGLAWMEIGKEGRSLFFARLDENGKLTVDPLQLSKPRPVPVMSHRLAVSRDQEGFVIAWVDLAPPMNTEIILSRVGF